MKKTFVFYNDRQDYTEEMSMEEKGFFLQVILDYQNGREIGDLGPIKFIRSRVKKQLDKDNESWEETIEKRRLAGIEGNKKRWGDGKGSQMIANATKGSQMIADNVNVNDTVNDTVNDIIKKETEKTTYVVPSKKFIKPSIDEVKNYCKERNNKVNPQSFIDFYESNGWLVGKNKMKDWMACVRTRESRSSNNYQKEKPQYEKKESRDNFTFM